MRRFTWVLAWESDGEHDLPRWVVLMGLGLAVVGIAGLIVWRLVQ